MKAWLKRIEDFFQDDPDEPEFDPADLASVLIVAMVAIGALYWLLWTLLVYERGIFSKLRALLRQESLDPGAFEGWLGNLAALILAAAVLAALHHLYWKAAGRRGEHGQKPKA